MRGQTMVHEVINSSLVVNAVYSVLVDMDTVTRSISANTTFSKLPTVNNENTTKTYENWTPLGPQFTHSKVNYTIGFKIFMFFWYNYVCQRNFVHCYSKLLLLRKYSPNNCFVHCKLNFTSLSLFPTSSGTHVQPTTEYTETTATSGAGICNMLLSFRISV